MIPGRNRRIHPRKVLRTTATVVVPGQPPREGRTWDLGLDGMSLMSAKPIPPGTRCEVTFELPLAAGASRVAVPVKVLYCSFCGDEGFKVGAAFGDLDDDSRNAVNEFTG
jgi:hypothetical protein